MPLALLLDLDGTLFDTFDAILASMNGGLATLGEPPLGGAELQPLIGMPVERQMAILRSWDAVRSAELADLYYSRFVERVETGLPLYPGVEETLAALADRPVGTMTTRRRETARRMLRRAGLDRHFAAIVGGDEVARPKPNPDLVLHAARAVGRPPKACTVVGDAPVDVQAGRAAGTWTVAARYGYGNPEELEAAGPQAHVDAFSELPDVLARLEETGRPPGARGRQRG